MPDALRARAISQKADYANCNGYQLRAMGLHADYAHGTQDRMVHHSASQRMFDALRAAHAPADMHLFHGHTHGFASLPLVRTAIAHEVAFFLDRTVVSADKHRAEIEQLSMFARRASVRPISTPS